MAGRSNRISLCNQMILLILSVTHMGQSLSFKKVTLNYINKKQEVWAVTLKERDSFLGNKHTPVWFEDENNPGKLILHHETMKNIGRFSIYQNCELSSAAVYFHNLNAMYGTIDIRFIIHEITVENDVDHFSVRSKPIPEMSRKFPVHKNRTLGSIKTKDLPPSINLPKKFEENFSNNTHSSVRLRRTLPEIIYVKVLVIIDFDVFKKISNGDYGRMGIVHYILTLFNSVDMLFSKMDGLNIKINIAGMIIRTNRAEFSALEKCYGVNSLLNRMYIDARCTDYVVHSLLKKNSKSISFDSYHFTIFLTSRTVRSKWPWQDIIVPAITVQNEMNYYQIKKSFSGMLPLSIVEYEKYYGNFYTIAHEITHALGFHTHDKGPYVNEQNACIAHIMKPCTDVCPNCLTWSPQTQMKLTQIFSSRDGCFFMKEPLSLEKPRIRQIWTADEQCQCYGFDKAISFGMSWMKKLFHVLFENKCSQNLRCINSNHVIQKVPHPLDGTLCSEDMNGAKKVCWNRRCKQIE